MELKSGYKQTEVGVIPNDWGTIGIIESSTLKARIGWQGLTTSEYLDNGDYFLVTGTDLLDGEVMWDTCHYVDKSRFDQDKNIQLKVGDILVTKDGTIGKVAFVDRLPLSATLNSGVFVIRPKDDSLSPEFFFHIFNSKYFDEFLRKLVAGSTINHLYQKDFITFKFPFPKKSEQTTIAKALSDANALITSLEKLIAKKRNIKQGAMQQLLKPKKGWVEKKLVDVVDYFHGKAHEQEIVEDGKYVVVNSKFISTEGIVVKYSNANFCPAKIGDVLTVLSDLPNGKALGKCFLVDINGKYAVNQRVCIWRTKGADPRFLFYLLNRHKYFLSLNDGVSQTHILNKHIEACIVSLPVDFIEQREIGEILFDIDKEITALENNLLKAKMIKQGMMQNLLTGKIRLV